MMRKSVAWGPITASGGLVLCALSIAVWWFYLAPHWPEVVRQAEFLATHSNIGQQAPSSSPSLASTASRPGASPVAPPELRGAPSGPHVDVAQASPNGDVVIAGRAEPGAKVALLDGGRTLLETATDPTTGEFVLLPARLEAGTHRLSLRSTSSSHAGQSQESFVMTIAVAPQGKASIAAKSSPPALAVSQTEPPSSSIDASKSAATIVRGDTLWRISRERLGHGALYPMVFQANSKKIRDPNLIYPGQVFMIP
jgi:nucleoid-associated protein YgaU